MFVLPRSIAALFGLAVLLFAGSAAQAQPRVSHCCCCCCCHHHVAHHRVIRHRTVFRTIERDETPDWQPAPASYGGGEEIHLTNDFTGGVGPAFIGGGGGGGVFVSGASSASANANASASAYASASASVAVSVSVSGHGGYGGGHGGHGGGHK